MISLSHAHGVRAFDTDRSARDSRFSSHSLQSMGDKLCAVIVSEVVRCTKIDERPHCVKVFQIVSVEMSCRKRTAWKCVALSTA